MEMFVISLISFIASLVGTVSGFGISTIMIPSLILFVPYYPTLFIVGVIHWINSVLKIVFFRVGISWRLIFLFGIPALLMSIIGALLISEKMLLPIIGIFLIIYSLFLFFKPQFYIPATNNMLFLGGTITGFSAGFFGIRGAIRSAFLSAFNLPKETYLCTTGVIALLVDTARLVTYWQQGILLQSKEYRVLLVFIGVSFLGAYVGRLIVNHIPQKQFRMVVMVFLLIMGVRLFLKLLF